MNLLKVGFLKILALDIATTTGWAFIHIKNKTAQYKYGTIKVNGKTRLQEIYKEIKDLIKLYEPNIVLIEDVFFSRNFRSYKILSMLHAAVYLGCIETYLPTILEANASAIRKAIGVKNSERDKIKLIVMKKINKMFGTRIKDNDITDALAIIVAYLNNKKVFKYFEQ